jgi:hypothetical protein
VGIKVLILVQGRSLISSGQITVGDLLAFFLYQGPLSASIRVRVGLNPTNGWPLLYALNSFHVEALGAIN